jgi:hypothetical protein
MHTKYWSENLKARDHYEGLGVDRKIILKCTIKMVWKDVAWIHLA